MRTQISEAVPVRYNGCDAQLGSTIVSPIVSRRLWEVGLPSAIELRGILFAAEGGQMVLPHGFMKRTQRTPIDEIWTPKLTRFQMAKMATGRSSSIGSWIGKTYRCSSIR